MTAKTQSILSLAGLPDVVLSRILGFDNLSFLTISLWKTGDKVLMSKMARSCERVNLKDKFGWSTSRWPKMLSELRQLRDLTIDRSEGYLMPSAELSFELRKLSPTLKSFKCECFGLFEAFLNFDSYKLPDGTIQQVEIRDMNPAMQGLLDIGQMWPQLETFEIESTLTNSFLQPALLTKLPASLTSLSFPTTMYQEMVDTLPPLLTSLRAHRFTNVTRWPQQLVHLHRAILNPKEIVSQLLALPRGLEDLIVATQHTNFTPELAAALPPSLTHLSLGSTVYFEESAQAYWVDALPKRLTKLSFNGISVVLSATLIAALPRTLTDIESLLADYVSLAQRATLLDEDGYQVKDLSFWPPRLQSLSLAGTFSNAHLALAHLPKRLSYLELEGPATVNELFPAQLETLEIRNRVLVTFEVPFPSTLTDLVVQGDAVYVPTEKWPSSLTSFANPVNTFPTLDFQIIALKNLPPTLTYLHMRTSAEMWKILPPSLVSFTTSVDGPKPTFHEVAVLPRNMELFNMSFQRGQGHMSGHILSMLPPGLTSLAVHDCSWDSDVLPMLPRKLRHLSLDIPNYEAEPTSKMPRDCLTSFNWVSFLRVQNHMSPSIIADLPEYLFLTSIGAGSVSARKTAEAHRLASQYPDERVLNAKM